MVYYEEMSYRNGVEMSNFESPNKVVWTIFKFSGACTIPRFKKSHLSHYEKRGGWLNGWMDNGYMD